MDFRVWPEAQVVELVRHCGLNVPAYYRTSRSGKLAIYEFVRGDPLGALNPRGPLPRSASDAVLDLIGRLSKVPRTALSPLPPEWPVDGDSQSFYRFVVDHTERLYGKHAPTVADARKLIEIPDDPLAPVRSAPDLRSRPSQLCHTDLHPGNILRRDAQYIFVDWEGALLGDPAYEVATHLHKSAYLPIEAQTFVTLAAQRLEIDDLASFIRDVESYLANERVKSIVVDLVRYPETALSSPSVIPALADRLARKLRLVAPMWQVSSPSVETLIELLNRGPGAGDAT